MGGTLYTSFRLLAILAKFRSDALAFSGQRVTGIFTTKKASASDRNATKIANSRKLLSNEPPLSHNWRYSLVLQAFLLCDIVPPLIGFDVH